MEYELPEIPEHYWVKKSIHRCKKCESVYDFFRGDETTIKLTELNGTGVKWMPVSGIGGYLYFMEELIPDYQVGQAISMIHVKLLDERLPALLETSRDGNPFVLGNYKEECPKCGSYDYVELSETSIKNPELDWIKVKRNIYRK